ncbi:thiamine pyrophosphate-dependent enzyme [Frankia sp. Cppng1_Ct_nod]|uniref:thiamine pyrophosphate-dependent enzyme n=1 Tax=Frankia sp. Cppng1_Ct_nod TaxID=2897162 RepID=UPI00202517BB|nr:thiamine pyrophosphate-dependent enzyme [Frankia sp. Cppng1_Ct_nod]
MTSTVNGVAPGHPDEATANRHMVRLLPGVRGEVASPGGYQAGADPALLRRFYHEMVVARRLDAEATALQRTGELGLWVASSGQEAAQVGSVHALRDHDQIFPSYREHAVALARGITPTQLLSLFRGTDFGGWDPDAHRFRAYTLVLATQTLHAVGYALGIRMERRRWPERVTDDEAVIVYFGDGAASEGDASEALSWAAVDDLPLVFFCQNNQWAISTPVARQTRVPLYRRAEGFGMPGVLVDGNDVVAVHAVTRAAVDRARAGGGPTFIEAYTYRLGGHSTADDPGRYRAADEVERWRARDPIARLRRYLDAAGLLDESFIDSVERAADELARHVRAAVPTMPDPAADRIHRHVLTDSALTDRALTGGGG